MEFRKPEIRLRPVNASNTLWSLALAKCFYGNAPTPLLRNEFCTQVSQREFLAFCRCLRKGFADCRLWRKAALVKNRLGVGFVSRCLATCMASAYDDSSVFPSHPCSLEIAQCADSLLLAVCAASLISLDKGIA